MVVDDDHGPARDVASQAQDPAVGIAGREGELPRADAEPPGQLLADPGRVVGREHVGDAAADLGLDGRDRRGGPVTGHGAGVAQAEIDVVMAVDTAEVGALGRRDVRRERSGPLDHPGHGHALEERPTSTRVKRRGTWMLLGEAGHLARHQTAEAVAIETGSVRHGPSMAGPSECRAAIPPRATRSGLVDPADVAADMAGGQPGVGVDIEEAGAAVGAAEEAARCGCGMAAATHAAHRGGSSGDGRSGGSGHHGGVRVLSGAPSSRDERSAARPGVSFGRYSRTWTTVVGCLRAGVRERGLGARTESSRRTGYMRSIRDQRPSVKRTMVLARVAIGLMPDFGQSAEGSFVDANWWHTKRARPLSRAAALARRHSARLARRYANDWHQQGTVTRTGTNQASNGRRGRRARRISRMIQVSSPSLG